MAAFEYTSDADKRNDIDILNRALFFEHRARGPTAVPPIE